MTSRQVELGETEESSPQRVNLCPNCGAPAGGNFCPQCGQETASQPQDLADFLRGLIAPYLSREGQLWQTLAKLFFAPGALTLEYMAGRRARYLRPFRLYLMASVIVFATVQFFGLNLGLRFYADHGLRVLPSTWSSACTVRPSCSSHCWSGRCCPLSWPTRCRSG